MKKGPLPLLFAAGFFVLSHSANSFAQNAAALPAATVASGSNSAVEPVPRDSRWMARHEGFVQQARQGGIDVLFLGDSITDNWRNAGLAVWNQYFAPLHAANFGIGGDRTQHVLWRMENGELDGIKPKVVVLLIGTNNTGKERNSQTIRNTSPQVIAGVTAVVRELRTKLPETKILFLAIFPRGDGGPEQQAQINEVNSALSKLDDGNMVRFLDLGSKFLGPDGSVPKSVMPDLLHPSAQGYQIWAEAMKPTLTQMLK